MLRIASLSLHPVLTANVHPYGCYVAKFVKKKKLKKRRKGLYYLLTKFEINSLIYRSPTLIWPKKPDPIRGKGNKIKIRTT